MTDSQVQALCRFGERTYKSSLPDQDTYCTAFGADDASSSTDCQEFKQDCLDERKYEFDANEDWECDQETAEESEGCTATVADFEACFKARRRAEADWAQTASCADATTFEGAENAAECDVLEEACDVGF